MEEEKDNWDYEQTEPSEEEEQDPISYQITNYPADITLKGYLDKYNSDQLEIPKFQRNYIWDQVRASKLIESFLLGLPVPGVFLYKQKETNRLQVIDGQQRILTAVRFFENDFGDRHFRLKNVNKKWEGRKYEDLDEADRLKLDDSVLRATIVQQLNPKDDSSIYFIFERLNTGGVRLNPMEIRKCIYFSDFYLCLEEINKNPDWRSLIGLKSIDKRLRDTELILRILALKDGWKDYEKPMKKFLNTFLSDKKKAEEKKKSEEKIDPDLMEQYDGIKREFSAVSKYLSLSLGKKPFHLRKRLNYAAMDSIFVAGFLAYKKGIKDLKNRYDKLIQDNEFIQSVSKSTSDENVVKARMRKAVDYFVSNV
ncbi:DUF262 domain-containing protein [Leptospirillum ferriphilum]|uniref:GmrSD restriction endonucleases N-terminal domain-containing protein n=1 Tax=Leptospirillum ferriphilum (strain ML-04) TaxID=1048260 RepID=J9ZER0_LEPFM|nr:DUF262 domain-containing protein [Leptospirillum ferriphilum]AFS54373.1 hypothetical protein LFML04_2181 [Leptospirillum ferriphilum ML-04]